MAEQLEQTEVLSITLVASSDVTFDYVCQPCSGDDTIIEAVGFCVDCSEFLCEDCFKYHRKPSLTRHHKLLDIEAAKKDEFFSGCLDICTEKCSQHRGKTIEYFCTDHDCLGCGVCITIDHRQCKDVQYIPNIAKDTGKGEEFSSLIRQLDMVLLQTKVLTDTSRGNEVKSQDTFDKAQNHVKQMRKDVNEAFKILEKEIEKEAKRMKINDMEKLDCNIKSCQKIQTKVENMKLKLGEMLKKEQYCNLFVAMKTNQIEKQLITKSLEKISSDNYVSDYLFQPGKELANFLKHVGSLGSLCKKDGIKTKALKVGKICLDKDSDSSACSITGLAMFTSQRLVAADEYNKKVKLIDIKQSKVISEFQLPMDPQDITVTEESHEIAVTQKQNCEIVLLRVSDDRLYEDKRIKTTSPCYGIDGIMDNFVVNLTAPERLEIIDKQGTVLQTIVKDETGEQLFRNVWSVAACRDTGFIFVPDYGKDTLTKFSMLGTHTEIYEDIDLQGPRYAAVDKAGAVYICGEKSVNIHQATRDCKKVRILLTKTDGLDSPLSLCCDEITDRLYVGQNNNVILIYQLA